MWGVGGGAEWTPLMGTSFDVGIRNSGADVSRMSGRLLTLGVEGHAVAVGAPEGSMLLINWSIWDCMPSVGLSTPRLILSSSKKVKSSQVKGYGIGNDSSESSFMEAK